MIEIILQIIQDGQIFFHGMGKFLTYLPNRFIFKYISIPKTEEAENGVDLIMRHSIRAEQYFKNSGSNKFESRYIGNGNELYDIFYPKKEFHHRELNRNFCYL